MRRSLALLLYAGAVATPAAAQTVAGRVTDRTSGFPVAGVVVSALDSAGTALTRAVTDSASGYRMLIPAGVARFSFRRIGYSPAEASLKDTVNGRLEITMSRLPTRLPPVKAVVTAQCDAGANGPDVLALWDQARSGMLTSLVAHDSKAEYTSVLLYQTSFKGDDETPRSVDRIEMPAGTSHPFTTGVEPGELARKGYLVREGMQNAFLAPDEGVLFDESFLTSHCFTLDAPSAFAGDSLIGIRFEPGKGSRNVDVKGVVWLRRDPLDLSLMEYSYANIDRRIERARPGGSLRFRPMPNGITMIQEWRIRSAAASGSVISFGNAPPAGLPTTRGRSGVAVIRRGAGRTSGMPAAGRQTVVTASETGAVIEMMQWKDAPPFLAPLATISGVVMDKQTGKPLANTPIRFYRTPFTGTTDSVGAFTLVDVMPGVYEFDAGDPNLEAYEASPELVGPVAIRYGPNDLKLEIDGPMAAILRGCKEKEGRVTMPRAFAGANAIFGILVADKHAVPSTEFTVDVLPAGAVPGSSAFNVKGKTDKLGRFRICGIPDGTATLFSLKAELEASQAVTLDPLHRIQLITLTLKRPPG
jgi:hypothetical protein